MYSKYVKRILDIILSLVILILFCWLYLIVAILVRVKLGSPILFKQRRPGYKEKIFGIYKFRTMTDERDENGNLLPDKDRLTSFGKLLRKTSLDEIPELFNILKGDMSFIGPRALPTSYQFLFTAEEQRRHAVRPGISGWAQINGRTSIIWGQKLKYDVEYVEKLTMWFDIKIFFLTIYKVFKRENVGIETSGVVSFHEYRATEWEEQGKHDLAVKALAQREALIKEQKRNDI